MKRLITIILVVLFIQSCCTEPDFYYYYWETFNYTDDTITVYFEGENNYNIEYDSIKIVPNKPTLIHYIESDRELDMSCTIIFDNLKITSDVSNNKNLRFAFNDRQKWQRNTSEDGCNVFNQNCTLHIKISDLYEEE